MNEEHEDFYSVAPKNLPDRIAQAKKDAMLRKTISKLRCYNPGYVFPVDNLSDEDDVSGRSIKKYNGTGKIYKNINFEKAALSGSKFIQTSFIGSSFRSAALHFSDFSQAKFLKDIASSTATYIEDASFIGARLISAKMDSVVATGADFALCNLTNAHISDSNFSESTFEGAIFNGALIENMSLEKLNLDYAEFDGAQFSNVSVSLMQIATCFGLNKSIKNGSLKIRKSKEGPTPFFNTEEFDDIIDDLISYYKFTDDYFALCNLLLFYKKDRYSFEKKLMEGLTKAAHEKDLRTVKYLCKLISKTDDYNNLRAKNALFNKIRNIVHEESDSNLLHEFYIHEGQLRSMLSVSDSENHPSGEVSFVMTSGIQKNSILAASQLVSALSQILYDEDAQVQKITLTKNSPISIIFQLFSENIVDVLSTFAAVITLIKEGKKIPFLSKTSRGPRKESISKINKTVSEYSISITEENIVVNGGEELHYKCIKKIQHKMESWQY
ncbi:MAG: pentapeptide repeat-containing protein [Spirochaetales bacterium]|nr:pentapeptide repeat-containing protein [Spirochaetales bacterium]